MTVSQPTEPTAPDPDQVVALARSVAGVADLTGGAFGSAATYLPGRRVLGVRIDDDFLSVHLVVTLERPIPDVAADVRRALAAASGGRRIDVLIEDVVAGGADPGFAEPAIVEPPAVKRAARTRRPIAEPATTTGLPEGVP